MSLFLSSLVIVLLRPGLHEAAYGCQLADGLPGTFNSSWLLYPPVVSTSALLFAMVLAVFKPWSRVRSMT